MSRPLEFTVGQPVDTDEVAALSRILAEAFNTRDFDFVRDSGADTARVVRAGGEVVGGLLAPVVGQYYGTRAVPMAALRAVGIAPHYRARGAGAALLQSVLAELYERGVPLSALYPSTQPVYRHQGFEQAGTWTQYRLPVRAIDVRDRSLEVDRLDPNALDWRAVADLYGRVAYASNGLLDRTDWFWRKRFFQGDEPAYAYAVSGDHGLQGYVSFVHRAGERRYDLVVKDIVAATPAAVRRLWSLLADHRSLAENVEWVGPPGESLLLGLAEMEAEVARRIHWLLRLVDIPAAIEARGYAHELRGELHLDVKDDTLPANTGHYVVTVEEGHARVARGGRAELKTGPRGLAALYTGYMSAFQLRQAGLMDGPDAAMHAATALFGGPAPWMVDFF